MMQKMTRQSRAWLAHCRYLRLSEQHTHTQRYSAPSVPSTEPINSTQCSRAMQSVNRPSMLCLMRWANPDSQAYCQVNRPEVTCTQVAAAFQPVLL